MPKIRSQRPSWGKRVIEVMKTQRHNQEWLAERIPIDRAVLSRILSGEREATEEVKKRIALLLGVPYAWLFTDVDLRLAALKADREQQQDN